MYRKKNIETWWILTTISNKPIIESWGGGIFCNFQCELLSCFYFLFFLFLSVLRLEIFACDLRSKQFFHLVEAMQLCSGFVHICNTVEFFLKKKSYLKISKEINLNRDFCINEATYENVWMKGQHLKNQPFSIECIVFTFNSQEHNFIYRFLVFIKVQLWDYLIERHLFCSNVIDLNEPKIVPNVLVSYVV